MNNLLRIRLRLHYTWFVAFILITVIVATLFPEAYTLWRRLLLGVTASLLFGAAIVTRQLILNFVALRGHIPLKNVTLFVFGGVPGITKEATLPIFEVLLSVAGFLSSLIVIGLFYMVYIVLVISGSTMVAGLIQWLIFITLLLSIFHLIPGFPLDGGRILRAVLWRATSDYDQATLITSWIGRGVGLLLIVCGMTLAITARQWFTGLLLAFVGWVLHSVAAQSNRMIVLCKALRNITARDIMSKEYPFITQQLSLQQLVRDYILVTGQRHFVVVDDFQLQGMVTMRHIKSVPKKHWESTRVAEIMTPASGLETAYANQSAADLLEQMNELEIDQLPVLEAEKVVGVVVRDSLIRLGRTRAEFGNLDKP